jgi:hypothetical protein
LWKGDRYGLLFEVKRELGKPKLGYLRRLEGVFQLLGYLRRSEEVFQLMAYWGADDPK